MRVDDPRPKQTQKAREFLTRTVVGAAWHKQLARQQNRFRAIWISIHETNRKNSIEEQNFSWKKSFEVAKAPLSCFVSMRAKWIDYSDAMNYAERLRKAFLMACENLRWWWHVRWISFDSSGEKRSKGSRSFYLITIRCCAWPSRDGDKSWSE